MENNWHVITGGPGTGKTVLINLLREQGYHTVPEAAREIFDEGLAKNQTLQQIRGEEQGWQRKILTRILKTESALDPKKLTFFDRGAHDGLAFLKLKNLDPGAYWRPVTDSPRKPYYKTVFLLEPLEKFEHDYMRTEDGEITRRLTALTEEVYAGAGMRPIRVPALPPAQRLALILNYI